MQLIGVVRSYSVLSQGRWSTVPCIATAKHLPRTRMQRCTWTILPSERIEYKRLSPTYKVLTATQPSYLHNIVTVQPPRSTRSSSLVTLARPSTSSCLRITDRSFQYASPRLCNQRPLIIHHLSSLGLKLSSSANPSHRSLSSFSSSTLAPRISRTVCRYSRAYAFLPFSTFPTF